MVPPSVRFGSLRSRRCRRPITLFMSFGTKPPVDIKRSLSYAVGSCSLAMRRLVPRTPTPLVRDGYPMKSGDIKPPCSGVCRASRSSVLSPRDLDHQIDNFRIVAYKFCRSSLAPYRKTTIILRTMPDTFEAHFARSSEHLLRRLLSLFTCSKEGHENQKTSGYQEVEIGVFSSVFKVSEITFKLYDRIDQNLTRVRELIIAIKRVPVCYINYKPEVLVVRVFSVCILLRFAIPGF